MTATTEPDAPAASNRHAAPGSDTALAILHLLHRWACASTAAEISLGTGIALDAVKQGLVGLKHRGMVGSRHECGATVYFLTHTQKGQP